MAHIGEEASAADPQDARRKPASFFLHPYDSANGPFLSSNFDPILCTNKQASSAPDVRIR